MVPLLLATGFSFDIKNEPGRLGTVAFFVIVYTALYSPGAGVSEETPNLQTAATDLSGCPLHVLRRGIPSH